MSEEIDLNAPISGTFQNLEDQTEVKEKLLSLVGLMDSEPFRLLDKEMDFLDNVFMNFSHLSSKQVEYIENLYKKYERYL